MSNFFGEAVNWIGERVDDVGDVISDVSGFVAGLPNELVGLADRIAAGQAKATQEARRQATEYQKQKLLGDVGPYILLGGLALAVFALSGK